MDALTPLLETGATLGLASTVTFQALKPFIEAWLVPPTSPLHDAALRIGLFVTALVLAALSTVAGLAPGLHLDGPGIWAIGKEAAGGWLVALLTFHALTGDVLDGPPSPPVVAVPVVPVAPLPVQRVELTHVVAPAPPPPAEPPALIVPSTSATPAATVQPSNGVAAAVEAPAPVATP